MGLTTWLVWQMGVFIIYHFLRCLQSLEVTRTINCCVDMCASIITLSLWKRFTFVWVYLHDIRAQHTICTEITTSMIFTKRFVKGLNVTCNAGNRKCKPRFLAETLFPFGPGLHRENTYLRKMSIATPRRHAVIGVTILSHCKYWLPEDLIFWQPIVKSVTADMSLYNSGHGDLTKLIDASEEW